MLEPLLVAGNLLPARLRERVYAASGGLTAVPAQRLGRPFTEDVAAWMTSGAADERFLRESVEPGGTPLLVDCRQRWPVTRVGDRHLFQFGAVGGATQEELFHGSDRGRGLPRPPPGRAATLEPTSARHRGAGGRVGVRAALAADVERFASQHGYRVRRLVFDDPTGLGPLVADLCRWWYRQRGLPEDRLWSSRSSCWSHGGHWPPRRWSATWTSGRPSPSST